MRILFLTHYYPPEIGAPQSRLSELATMVAAKGHSVTIVTGFPNYPTGVIPPEYRGTRFMEERLGGVRILRTWVYAARNRGFTRRILNHLSFAASSLWAIRKVGQVDVIFVESPPLLIGFAALAYSRIKRSPFVLNISDIWPQSAVELGALRSPFAIWLAERLELHLYRKSNRVSVVTAGMLERLAGRGVPVAKLYLLTNGVDTALYRPLARDSQLAQRLGIDGHKVFLYAGTHGMAQGLEVVLEAAKQTTNPSILYVLAGEGAEKESLVMQARAQRIANVIFLPNQPKAVMPALLNLAYASIIPLKRLDLFKSALPSKMFEAMATARPIVAAVWGEAAELIEAAECGIVVPPEDPASIRDAVERLAEEPELAKTLGQNGRAYVIRNFDRKDIVNRFAELLWLATRGVA